MKKNMITPSIIYTAAESTKKKPATEPAPLNLYPLIRYPLIIFLVHLGA